MYNIEYLLLDLRVAVKKYMMRRKKAIHRSDLLSMIYRRLKIEYKVLYDILSHILIDLEREGIITVDEDGYIRPVRKKREIPSLFPSKTGGERWTGIKSSKS